ncbi:MAG TPA: hypothetical protein VK012_00160 [Gemmatimonadales bacterium]|nr:hypothetical protein [Gemmatimonadales bacterium]
MVRFAWTGWWLALVLVTGPPLYAQDPADPPSVELRDNYPNPFNASTTIPFTIRPEVCRNGHEPTVTLEIYNVLGQVVAVPVLAEQRQRRIQRLQLPCGEHEAIWDGRLLDGAEATTGIYWYYLTVDERRQANNMILQRRVTSSK